MPFRPPAPGLLLDNKYRLAERIGGGGMGDVYRAENVLAGRSVAIKFLHPELAQNPELAQRFFQEAQAVNMIRHPNIVDILDAAQGETGPYLVMEYLEGESVGSSLNRLGKLDVDTACAVVIPVTEALHAAHRANIVHRDLKPENVFVAFDSARNVAVVKLLDFGIAKVMDQNNTRTRTGVVFGTPDYLSPEQATAEAPLDGRSDLFSVGVLLYELLTGTRPFKAPTAVATAFRIVHAEAPTLASSGITVDPRLEAAVTRLLQKEPSKRFATAGDLSRELERVVPDATRRRDALTRLLAPSRKGAPLSMPDRTRMPEITGAGMSQARPVQRRMPFPEGNAPTGPLVSRRTPTPPEAVPASRESSPRSARYVVRPFPARFAGRFQVRGPVLGSIDRAVKELAGPAARAEIVAAMPEPYAADFRNDSINAMVGYDLEALDAYMELATAIALRDAGKWRAYGRHSVDGELNSVVKMLLRPSADLAGVIRRGVTIWARLFSFGAWRVSSTTPSKVTLHVGDFDPASQALRLWLVGMIELTASRAVSSDVKVTIALGEMSFSPELSCEIS